MIFFLFLRDVELRHVFFPSKMNRGCQVCVIGNSNSIHRLIFNFCIIFVHTLKMCTSYFMRISLFSFLEMLTLGFFLIKMLGWCLVCEMSNSNSFHSLLFKLCIISVHTIFFCAHLINIFLFSKGLLKLDRFFHPKSFGCLVPVICNSSSFHTFIFKPYIMIIHTWNMCTLYFVHIIHNIFLSVELRHCHVYTTYCRLHCVICV